MPINKRHRAAELIRRQLWAAGLTTGLILRIIDRGCGNGLP
jgi:hypothetical protein